jgi:hypothetical protein
MDLGHRTSTAGIFSAAVLLAGVALSAGPAGAPVLSGEVSMSPKAPVLQRSDSRFEAGEPFPEVALPRLADGVPTSLAAFRGDKIILHVFASW